MGFMDIFKKKPDNSRYAQMLNGGIPIFSQFGRDVFASDVVQMCVDSIATECSKLEPKHIREDEDGFYRPVKSSINRLLRLAPNELMTTRDFIEKIIWKLYSDYNAFIYPMFVNANGRREYTGFYPLAPVLVEFLQDPTQRLFIKMTFENGTSTTLPYSDVIHLRKKYSVNDLMGGGMFGQPDNEALLKVLDINNSLLQGLDKAIKSSFSIRGILKVNTMLDEAKITAERERFEKQIKENGSGILAADLKGEYVDLKPDPKLIDAETLKFLNEKILFYYGVSMPILSGDYTDEQYQAFYEKTLEPIVVALGQAFSKTVFTMEELNHGNRIYFYPSKLLFTNTKNKIAAADVLGNRGALTNNQLLELFGYPPYEGGDIRVMSLNYIDATLATEYQLKRAGMSNTEPAGPAGGEKNER